MMCASQTCVVASQRANFGTNREERVTRLLQVMTRLCTQLKAHATKHGDERRPTEKDKQGHQKTPGFVRAVLQDVLTGHTRNQSQASPPQAGFTDVGLHTGGTPRETCWAMVREVLALYVSTRVAKDSLDGSVKFADAHKSDGLLKKMLAHMFVWIAEGQLYLLRERIGRERASASGVSGQTDGEVDAIEPEPQHIEHSTQVNVIMKVLQASAAEGAALIDSGMSMSGWHSRVKIVRSGLDLLQQSCVESEAKKWKLPPPANIARRSNWRDPDMRIPPRVAVELDETLVSALMPGGDQFEAVLVRLGRQSLPSSSDGVESLLTWAKDINARGCPANAASTQLLLATIEQRIFRLSSHNPCGWQSVGGTELAPLFELVQEYNAAAEEFMEFTDVASVSRE